MIGCFHVKVLLIDEISMIDADLLSSMDNVLRRVRKNDTPFGGIQVVIMIQDRTPQLYVTCVRPTPGP